MEDCMKIPDEEISQKVSVKLTEKIRWNKDTIKTITTAVKDGIISTTDLIFLLENQRPESKEI
jgi:hypothetical protein